MIFSVYGVIKEISDKKTDPIQAFWDTLLSGKDLNWDQVREDLAKDPNAAKEIAKRMTELKDLECELGEDGDLGHIRDALGRLNEILSSVLPDVAHPLQGDAQRQAGVRRRLVLDRLLKRAKK